MGSTLERNQQKSQSPFFNGIRKSRGEARHPLFVPSEKLDRNSGEYFKRTFDRFMGSIRQRRRKDERDGGRTEGYSFKSQWASLSLSGDSVSLPPLSAGCSSGQFKRNWAEMSSKDRKHVCSATTLQIASCTNLGSWHQLQIFHD